MNNVALVHLEIAAPRTELEQMERRICRPLLHTLGIIGVKPIDPSSVDLWKIQKLHNLTPTINEYCKTSPGQRRLRAILPWLAFSIAAGLTYLALRTWFSWALLLEFYCLTWYVMEQKQKMDRLEFLMGRETRMFGHAKWETVGYNEYVSNLERHYFPSVPEEVRDTAEEIRMRLPGVELEVEHLELDPFLKVRYYNQATGETEQYYIRAWDERGFVF